MDIVKMPTSRPINDENFIKITLLFHMHSRVIVWHASEKNHMTPLCIGATEVEYSAFSWDSGCFLLVDGMFRKLPVTSGCFCWQDILGHFLQRQRFDKLTTGIL